MRAIVLERFGGPEVLELKEIERPRPGPGELLVRVVCAGTNPVDAKLRQSASWAGLTPPLVAGLCDTADGSASDVTDPSRCDRRSTPRVRRDRAQDSRARPGCPPTEFARSSD